MIQIGVKVTGLDQWDRTVDRIVGQYEKAIEEALVETGMLIEGHAKRSIQEGPKTGRVYRRGNRTHQASAPGEAPATDTGTLVSSITYSVDKQGLSVRVGTNLDIGLFLEMGTVRIEARPWLQPALDQQSKNIQKTFERKLGNAIKGR